MNFLKYIFIINLLFVSIYGINLIRFYILSKHHFNISGFSFFKGIVRLINLNLLLYLVLLNFSSNDQVEKIGFGKQFYVAGSRMDHVVLNKPYLDFIKSNVKIEGPTYALNYIDLTKHRMAKIIPSTTSKSFFNYINNPEFGNLKPVFMYSLPNDFKHGEGMFVNNENNKIIQISDLKVESSMISYLFGTNWKSSSSLSFYLLFLLITLISLDILFTFQILIY